MAVVDDAGLKKQMAAGELSGLFVVAGEEKYMGTLPKVAKHLVFFRAHTIVVRG